ncbi:MAG TPA: fumarylacetoacetate hydrolase family protein, partial [Candidatus Hydrogenedentes bacterium]|nr:fumarylacetoacetate hydrolase family protein [Candidatus Hydrogenedentota bacterium]
MRIARVIDRDDRTTWAVEQKDGQLLRIEGDPLSPGARLTDKLVAPQRWLPPIEPSAIFCIGLNYRKHAEESGAPLPEEPVVFMKNPAAATGHLEAIRIPKVCEDEVDYEAELAVVIDKTCRDVSRDEALEYVVGYTCANDVSARVWQQKRGGGQWVRGKSFDTFAPMGPVLLTPDEIPDPKALSIRCELN